MLGWLVLLLCLWRVQAFPSGLVSASCDSLTPLHSGTNASTEQPPYSISLDSSTYTENQTITVNLTATSALAFKGFLLEAFEVGGSSALGSFTLVGNNSQLLNCSSQSNSAVSHISGARKFSIQSKWKAPPSGSNKTIEFRTTFVKNFTLYWVGVKSSALTYNGTQAPVTPPAGGPSTQSSSSVLVPVQSSISSSGCGSSKTCFSQPTNCDPASSSSCYFMSATPTTAGSAAGFKFEIVGSAEGYVSIGFSDDTRMGNDDIYICGKDVNGNIQLQHAFSTGTTTPTTITLGDVSGLNSSVVNGVISCSFTSANPISTTRTASTYYIFLAYGDTKNGVIQMHSSIPFISTSKVDLSSLQNLGSAEQYPPIIKAHGCLMLISWMTVGSLGMLIARYLKRSGDTKCCGKDIWFVTHVFLMVLTVCATIIAFILVFSYARDWSGGAHPVLGVIVMTLSLVQPIAALFRCGPTHEKRFLFNWAHAINALAIKGLAVAAIFTGLVLVDTSEQQWLPKVMGGFVTWEALFFLLQDLHHRWTTEDVAVVGSEVSSTGTVILVIFLLGNITFLVALLVGIGQA